jgi:hypothetical protein
MTVAARSVSAADKPDRPRQVQEPTVYALLQIALQEPSAVRSQDKPIEGEFVIYRGTQMTLLTSRLVLNAALKQPGVAELDVIKKQKDPVSWLEKNLHVDNPHQGAILRVGLSGGKPKELAVLVNAVADAYLKEVVNRDRSQVVERLNKLKEMIATYEQSVQQKKQAMQKIAQKGDTPMDPQAAALMQQRAEQALAQAKAELVQWRADMRRLQREMQGLAVAQSTAPDMVIPDALIVKELGKDKVVAQLLQEIAELEERIQDSLPRIKGGLGSEVVKRMRDQVEDKNQKIADRQKVLRPVVIRQLRNTARENADENAAVLRRRVAQLNELEKVLQKDVARLTEESRQIARDLYDVNELREEIAYYQSVLKAAQSQAEALKVELATPPRVALIQKAEAPKSK